MGCRAVFGVEFKTAVFGAHIDIFALIELQYGPTYRDGDLRWRQTFRSPGRGRAFRVSHAASFGGDDEGRAPKMSR
jgi:hypothetical protein